MKEERDEGCFGKLFKRELYLLLLEISLLWIYFALGWASLTFKDKMFYVNFFFDVIPLLAVSSWWGWIFESPKLPLLSALIKGRNISPTSSKQGSQFLSRNKHLFSPLDCTYIMRQVYTVYANKLHDCCKEQLLALQDFIYNYKLHLFS